MLDKVRKENSSQITKLDKKLGDNVSFVTNYMISIDNYYNNKLAYKFIQQVRFWCHPKIFSNFAIYIFYTSYNLLSLLID